ncbi:hypothetical protein [Rothia sp. ZJ1223]|uniref:hypothetical protein n=1 Tax=Rothia sp. ZJ1223 TaxID=2811098 RepID=UPI00195C957F|nr:hypothetical protein [Rothia sp. ZJ1223]MBM7051546.1 hypothetical protein [Rothia sp. ZJ1223]
MSPSKTAAASSTPSTSPSGSAQETAPSSGGEASASASRKAPTITERTLPAGALAQNEQNEQGQGDQKKKNETENTAVLLPVYTLSNGQKMATALSPSGNIACEIYVDRAQCSVLSLSESAPHVPGQVGVPGWSYAVNTQGAVYDTQLAQAPLATLSDTRGQVLQYGTRAGWSQFELLSEETGMTLRDTRTGHGATFNRDGITTF